MNRLTAFMTCLYLLVICVMGASADPREPEAPALPIQLEAIGPAQVILHGMQLTNHRLTLEIRSPEITSIPAKSAIRLSFDTQITHTTQPQVASPLTLETVVADRHITFFLARDPFAFPQPWTYMVTIAFNQLPRTGAIAFGDAPPQDVTFPAPSSTTPALPGT